MKFYQIKITIVLGIVFILGGTPGFANSNNLPVNIIYEIDLNNHSDDLFHVAVTANGLTAEDSLFSFVSIVPGTYSISDFGRFVKSFAAFDSDRNPIKTRRASTNQWLIEEPSKVSTIEYDIEDSFDSDVKDIDIAPMSGTGIQENFIILNTFGVLGYFEQRQTDPVKLKITMNTGWDIGTALERDEDGYFYAASYDLLADSPMLLAKLSHAVTRVDDVPIDIYVYSPDTAYRAQNVLQYAQGALEASGRYMGCKPVSRYCFLIVLLDMDSYDDIGIDHTGALEHSYSSLYYFTATDESLSELESVMAHEFLHTLTPLNLHSDILYPFDFQHPTASRHIWLYEGVTEWESDIMLLRSGEISLGEYLKEISRKLTFNDYFEKDISLDQMSLGVFDEGAHRYFGNFFNKGALTALCLDIKLLELSDGERGLREVFLDLVDEYGAGKAFPENEFYDIFVDFSYPEIDQFIRDYIRGTEPLPIKDLMAVIGINYIPERDVDDQGPSFGFSIRYNNNDEFFAGRLENSAREFGLKDGDRILQLLGREINMDDIKDIYAKKDSMQAGDTFEVLVNRDNEELKLQGILQKKVTRHILDESEKLTDKQALMRQRWCQY